MPLLRSRKQQPREEAAADDPDHTASTAAPVASDEECNTTTSKSILTPEVQKDTVRKQKQQQPEAKHHQQRSGSSFYATLSNSFRRVASGGGGGTSKQAAAAVVDDAPAPEQQQQQEEWAAAPPRRRIKKKKVVVEDVDDDDPVMAVFEARAQATSRVRFSVEPELPRQQQAATNRIITAPEMKEKQKEEKASAFGIQKFMKNALFGKGNEETEAGLQKEIDDATREVVWESAANASTVHNSQDFVRTRSGRVAVSFTEDPETRAKVNKLLNKARRAQCVHYRYEVSVMLGLFIGD